MVEKVQLNLEAMSQKAKQKWDVVAIIPEEPIPVNEPLAKVPNEVFETLSHALIHCVANSVSHGYLNEKQREANGWDPVSSFVFDVSTSDDKKFLKIQIGDDGPGPDWQLVRKKAHELGIEIEKYVGQKKWDLFFLPRFSTAIHSHGGQMISGRGVGLDSIKEEWESIGGTISITQKEGHGFIVQLQIPLKNGH